MVAIRSARLEDLPGVVDIYNHYVRHSPATFDLEPWRVDERHVWLSSILEGPPRHRFLVAEANEGLLGYAYTGAFRDRPAYDVTVESTVYLAPDACGQGFGAALYNRLFDGLADAGVRSIIAAVTLPNPASLRLHQHFGFAEVGVLRRVGRKFDRYWDVAWLQRAFGPAEGL